MTLLRQLLVAVLSLTMAGAVGLAPVGQARAATGWTLVDAFPHDPNAWTQGLAFRRGLLYETTGLYGRSSLRRVDLATGRVTQIRRLADRYFAEGLAFLDGRAWVLTWKESQVLQFDPTSFVRLGHHTYRGEGWGLTTNGRKLIMSNGSDVIRFRSPRNFGVTRAIRVTEAGQPVTRLNELEWVDGYIWANVWLTPHVVVIDPRDGRVVRRLDFTALLERERDLGNPSEMNGIAYLASSGRLFVTGKFWRNLYEIRLAVN